MAEYSHGVSDQHLALYRKKAGECLQQAENCLNSPDKEMWLRLAEDWATMAQEVERRDEHKVTSTTGGELSERRRTVMENPDRAQIILRAYKLWERAGSPEGRAEEFYYLAEQQLRDEEQSDPTRTPDNL
jgi:hypothetical protein